MNRFEQTECIRFMEQVNELSSYTPEKPIVLHIANERKTSPITGSFLKRMGVRAGTPDYLIIWDGIIWDGGWIGAVRIGFLEFKHYTGKKPLHLVTKEQREKLLTESQLAFRERCLDMGINHFIPLSANEGIDALFQWGVFKNATHTHAQTQAQEDRKTLLC